MTDKQKQIMQVKDKIAEINQRFFNAAEKWFDAQVNHEKELSEVLAEGLFIADTQQEQIAIRTDVQTALVAAQASFSEMSRRHHESNTPDQSPIALSFINMSGTVH